MPQRQVQGDQDGRVQQPPLIDDYQPQGVMQTPQPAAAMLQPARVHHLGAGQGLPPTAEEPAHMGSGSYASDSDNALLNSASDQSSHGLQAPARAHRTQAPTAASAATARPSSMPQAESVTIDGAVANVGQQMPSRRYSLEGAGRAQQPQEGQVGMTQQSGSDGGSQQHSVVHSTHASQPLVEGRTQLQGAGMSVASNDASEASHSAALVHLPAQEGATVSLPPGAFDFTMQPPQASTVHNALHACIVSN